MKSAEKIVRSSFLGQDLLNRLDVVDARIVFYLINEARKECIMECADLLNPKNSERMKQKMLSLINKLKADESTNH